MDSIGTKLWDTLQTQIVGGSENDSSSKRNSRISNDGNDDTDPQRESGTKPEKQSDLFGSIFSMSEAGKLSVNSLLMGHSSSGKEETNNKQKGKRDRFMKKSKSLYSIMDNNDEERNGKTTTSKTGDSTGTTNTNSSGTASAIGGSYADKFVERIISMAIPTTTTSSKRELDRILGRIEMQKTRPQLSVQIMSKNSVLLLQRLSIPFETIDSVINFLNWKTPLITIIGMLFLSLCILKPINFLTVPIFYICFEIIVPAYMVQNPNIDESVETWDNELPKPVNEFSREFLLNVTDLQNHMLLYVSSWDFVNTWCWKLFYFRDEMLTWFIFVSLLSVGIVTEFFGASILYRCIPVIKLLLVLILWAVIILLHPKNRVKVLEAFYSEELRLKTMSLINHYESKVIKDLDLTTDQTEIKQMEIFELQFYNEETKCWQFVCFSNDIYPINSHLRLNDIPIKGTSLLDGIVPPKGWKYVNNSELLEYISSKSNAGHNAAGNRSKVHTNILESSDSSDSFENDADVGDDGGGERKAGDAGVAERTGAGAAAGTTHTHRSKNDGDATTIAAKDCEREQPRSDSKGRLSRRLVLDSDKKKIQREKRKHQKLLKRKNRASMSEFAESDQAKVQRRRESNDFNHVLLDPLVLNKKILDQLETGVKYDGWYLDLCPDNWVYSNYLQGVLDIDNDTKWVYDLVVMGNGIDAYSAGLGVTRGKLKRNRGDVRRRRWIRYAVKDVIRGIDRSPASKPAQDSVLVSSASEEDESSTESMTDLDNENIGDGEGEVESEGESEGENYKGNGDGAGTVY